VSSTWNLGRFEIASPLTPALSPQGGEGEREQIWEDSNLEFDWIFQVGVIRKSPLVSPLSLWERVRVRGSSAFHNLCEQLVGMDSIGVFVEITGEDQLVRLGLLDQHLKLGADLLRAADHGKAKEIAHRFTLMG